MIDKNRIEKLRNELKIVLANFAKENDLKVSPFNVTYSETQFKFTCTMGEAEVYGNDVNPEHALKTNRYGWVYGLTQADCGKEFIYRGKKVIFCGMTSSTKAVYKLGDQKFKCDLDFFAKEIGKEKVTNYSFGA